MNADPDVDEDEDDDQYVIKSDDEEQFACTICRGPFRNAVETKYDMKSWNDLELLESLTEFAVMPFSCGHFFCEACALKHFKKSTRCFNCRKQTNGTFSDPADKADLKNGQLTCYFVSI